MDKYELMQKCANPSYMEGFAHFCINYIFYKSRIQDETSASKLKLSHTVALDAVLSMAIGLLLSIHCLLLHPLFVGCV